MCPCTAVDVGPFSTTVQRQASAQTSLKLKASAWARTHEKDYAHPLSTHQAIALAASMFQKTQALKWCDDLKAIVALVCCCRSSE